jgi:hypothetical protein
MKRILFLLLTLSAIVGKAQNFEGIISWKMTTEITDPKMKAQMEEAQQKMNDPATQAQMKEMQEKMNDPEFKKMMESNPQMKAQIEAAMKMMEGGDANAAMPTGFVVKIKNQNMAMLIDGGMFKMETLYLHDKNASFKIDRSAKTYSPMPSHTEDPNNKVEVKVTKTSETAKVLDYTCTKYIVDIKSKSTTMQQLVWSTTAIKDFDLKSLARQRTGDSQYRLFYEQIEGVPLKTEMTTPQGKMTMEAAEIKRQSLPASDFVIPSGYKEVPFSVF